MSISDKGDDELREAVSQNEARAEWGGAAVVFGLVVEVVLTATYRHGESIIEAWGPVFADALIALGVAAEIIFARKARSKAEALQRRSNEKVAEANARSSEANQKAQEAQLELARFRAPRSLSIEQQKRVASKIRSFTGIQFDVAVPVSDTEALTILEMIEAAVRAADWMQIDWADTVARSIALDRPGLPRIGNTSISNVLIQFEAEHRPRLESAANALASAINAEGVPSIARANFGAIAAANTTAIHILVGRKA